MPIGSRISVERGENVVHALVDDGESEVILHDASEIQ